MAKNIIVNYDGKNQHSLSAGPTDLIRLNPGLNTVDAETFERVLAASKKEAKKSGKVSGLLFLMENDIVTVVPSDEEGGSVSLDKLTAPKAIAIVEGESDLGILASLLSSEESGKNRTTVVTAINNQIETLEAANNKDGDDE